MPDRSSPPPIYPVRKVRLPPIERLPLSGGIPLYHFLPGDEEVLRLDILMDAGRPRERYPLTAKAVGALLKEGTASFTGAEVAEKLDFYGASLSTPFQMDGIHLVVYMLTRHAPKILPVVASVLLEPTFPETELENLKTRLSGHLQVELKKPDVVAYRELTRLLFGDHHPYGYNSSPELYRSLSREMLKDHYGRYFTSGNATLILSGGGGERVVRLVDELICAPMPRTAPVPQNSPQADAVACGVFHQELLPSVQTAIRIGRRMPNRHHPDYPGLYLINMILGGYFGSRLMANIREDKGYTYNIYSSLDSFRFDGYFYVGTEVGHSAVGPTVEQIHREMQILREEPVPQEELAMVKNYIMGSFLSLLDGPFQTADLIKGLLLEGLPIQRFGEWVEAIREMDAGTLQALASHYLRPEDMWEVAIGKSD